MIARQLLVTLFCLIAPLASAAEMSCLRPDIDSFLEQSHDAIQFRGSYFASPKAKFLPFDADGRGLQWMGASWEGPPDGALFVLDCAGTPITVLHLGHVQQLRAGPTVSGIGQTFEVIYISGTGTGVQEESISLVAFVKNSIVVLWNHEASESVSAPSLGTEYSDKFSWRFDDEGTRIEVTGQRKVGKFTDVEHGWAPSTTHAFQTEAFCWNTTEKAYKPCSR